MTIFQIFLLLFFCNLVLDYSLQSEFLIEYKQKNNYVLFVHCAIWGIGLALVLIPFNLFAYWKLIMLIIGHFIIDYWKCRRIYKKQNLTDYQSYYIDQFLHTIQVALLLI